MGAVASSSLTTALESEEDVEYAGEVCDGGLCRVGSLTEGTAAGSEDILVVPVVSASLTSLMYEMCVYARRVRFRGVSL